MPDTRIVTLLFCDLVASTELMARIGDDANDIVRRRFFAAMREAIASNGGLEVKTVGDEFMVAFTESAADAIACAVAMQRGVARLNERDPLLRLAIRVGLSAGEAELQQDDWYGTPVVEASRLEGKARPGQILAADHLLKLVGTRGGHTFTSVGALKLKGLPEPLPTSEVAWEPDPGLPSIPLPSGLDASGLPFAGRDRELDALVGAWDDAVSGQQRFVLVSGEAASGKTRLAAELARRVHSDQTTVLYGRSDQELDVPYQPFTEVLRWYVISAGVETLRRHVEGVGADLASLVPALRHRLPELADPQPAAGADQRLRLLEAVATALRSAAEQAPILLVLDDLHAAREPTLAMLRHLLEGPSTRLLVLGLADETSAGSTWSEARAGLLARPGSFELALEGLSTSEIASSLGRLPSLAPGPGIDRLAARLRDETDGSPGFVSELVARIEQSGGLTAEALERVAGSELPPAVTEVLDAACPYLGLRAYEPDDASLFFGREEAVVGLLARLASGRLLTVVGASGSGKSSLVRAGLVPQIRRGALPGSQHWPTVVMTPGAEPLAALSAQLAALTGSGAASILRDLEADERTLDLVVRQTLLGAPDGGRVLLVIDQFEELFTLCRDEAQRARFIDALLYAVSAPDGQLVAVIAMRADFYSESAAYPGFASALEASHTLLGPMDEAALRSVIEEPAAVANLRVEPGLAELMVADVLGEPGGLPLLSHALLETWQRRDGRSLTAAGYSAAGGVRGAIARTADAEYEALSAEEQAIARNLFVRLTELGEGTEDTRRRATRTELVPVGASAESVDAVIQRLADARLLTTGEETVEVAHEALIREWPRLRGWLDDDREALRTQRHVTESAQAWLDLGRDEGELYRGARLSATVDALANLEAGLNPLEQSFLDASIELQERELREAEERAARQVRQNRILRAALGGVGVLLVVSLVVAAFAIVQQMNAADARDDALSSQAAAERARGEAEDARGRADAANLEATLARIGAELPVLLDNDPSLAMLLAVQARHLDDRPQTQGFMQQALAHDPRLQGFLGEASANGSPEAVAIHPSGDLIAVRLGDGRLRLIDVESRDVIAEVPTNSTGALNFNADGSLLAAGGRPIDIVEDDAVSEIQLFTVPELTPLWTHEVGVLNGVIFTPDGDEIIYPFNQGAGGTVLTVRDAASGAITREWIAPTDEVISAGDVSPDGSLIAIGFRLGRLIFLDATDFTVLADLTAHEGRVLRVRFAPDGRTFFTSSDGDRNVKVWDVASMTQIGEPFCEACGATMELSADGRTLLTADVATAQRWDVTTREPLGAPTPKSTGLVRLFPDGQRIAAVLHDRLALWDFTGVGLVTRVLEEARGTIALSPNGNTLITQLENGEISGWNLEDGTRLFTSQGLPGRSNAPRFRPDGEIFVTTHSSGCARFECQGHVTVWDARTGQQLREPIPVQKSLNFLPVEFSNDGELLAIGHDDGTVQIWDAIRLVPLGERVDITVVPEDEDGVIAIARFTFLLAFGESDGRRLLATMTGNGEVTTWDATSLPMTRITAEYFGGFQNSALKFTPEGQLAIAKIAGPVDIIDPYTLEPAGPTLTSSQEDVSFYQLTFTPDGQRAVAGGPVSPGPTRLFDVPSGEQVGVSFGDGFRQRQVTPDGRFLVIGSDEGAVVWDLDPDRWEAAACQIAGRNMTQAEWDEFFPGRRYQVTCERWPSGAEAS